MSGCVPSPPKAPSIHSLSCSDAGVCGQDTKNLSGTADPVRMHISANATTPPGRTWRAAARTAAAGSPWYISTSRPTSASNGSTGELDVAKVPEHELDVLDVRLGRPPARPRERLLVTLDPYHRTVGADQL